jgi:hypothetical protein
LYTIKEGGGNGECNEEEEGANIIGEDKRECIYSGGFQGVSFFSVFFFGYVMEGKREVLRLIRAELMLSKYLSQGNYPKSPIGI